VTLLSAARGFPPWARLVFKSRPDDRALSPIYASEVIDLQSESARTTDDVNRFARARIEAIISRAPEHGKQASELLSRSNRVEPNFLYLRLVLDDFSLRPVDYSDYLPRSMVSLRDSSIVFLNHDWPCLHRVLGLLSVAREPISEQGVANLTGLTLGAIRRGTVSLSQFQRRKRIPDAPDSFSLFHPSFTRSYRRRCERSVLLRSGHQRLIGNALGRAGSIEQAASDVYLCGHVVAHLVGARDVADLESLPGSYTWCTTGCSASV
jgi:hypothetical protein